MCSYTLVIVWISVRMAAAQLYCDQLTQYEKDGRCCLMCEPGTSMMAMSSCEEPQCKECQEDEYQDKHTTASVCKLQPYCDPNRNFQVIVHPSKTARHVCTCQHGFHCSSDECFTCVPHTVCEAGYGALHKGNHSRDTVCQKCPVGTFSNQRSWDGVCETWTKCEEGYHVEEKGSNTLDIRCAKSRVHHAIIVITVLLLVVALIIIAAIFVCQRKKQHSKLQQEDEDAERMKTVEKLQVEVTKDEFPGAEGHAFYGQPLEVKDLTENGNIVQQEDGKIYIVSQEESQTPECEV